ncbi:endonuclease V [Verrucomicrobium sp. BvORR034]|uniref:endonuclease V n=1 Tax=Verrucomicrobium sp. BvORR034 TaxID=1396418 RepID=UPI0007C761BA|nr:endonuclease V [Verrucomicrobium sp. BvORR034]
MSLASPMVCLDVHYADASATVAAVVFSSWTDDLAIKETTITLPATADYEPGEFYKRELPCLMAAIQSLDEPPALILIDGYVWLGLARPGLGARLYDALETRVPVVGVAKTAFHGQTEAVEVFRGGSQRPLFVTAAGVPPQEAAVHVKQMHGEHRLPTLIKRADQLCRGRV